MEFLRMCWHAPGGVWRGMMGAPSAILRQWHQAGAAMAFTLFAAAVVLIIWRGPWSAAVEAKRVDGLVMIALAGLFIALAAIVAMNGQGLRLKAGKGGLEAELDTDDHAPAATVTTTTRTTVEPAPAALESAASADGELPPDQRVER